MTVQVATKTFANNEHKWSRILFQKNGLNIFLIPNIEHDKTLQHKNPVDGSRIV